MLEASFMQTAAAIYTCRRWITGVTGYALVMVKRQESKRATNHTEKTNGWRSNLVCRSLARVDAALNLRSISLRDTHAVLKISTRKEGLIRVPLALNGHCDECAQGLITGSQKLKGFLRSFREAIARRCWVLERKYLGECTSAISARLDDQGMRITSSISIEHCRGCVTSILIYVGKCSHHMVKFMWQADVHGIAKSVADR